MNSPLCLNRENAVIKASVGANKDVRHFYSTSYSTEYNSDLMSKLPTIIKKRPNSNAAPMKKQETGFSEDVIPFISADWRQDQYKPERYNTYYNMNYGKTEKEGGASLWNRTAIMNSGYTTSNRNTYMDMISNPYSGESTKNFKSQAVLPHINIPVATNHGADSVFGFDGTLIPRGKVDVYRKKVSSVYAKHFESELMQKRIYQPHSSEPTPNIPLNQEEPVKDKVFVSASSGSAFSKAQADFNMLSHAQQTKPQNTPQLLLKEIHEKKNPPEDINRSATSLWSSITKECFKYPSKTSHNYQVGKKEESGAIHDFHPSSISVLKYPFEVTEAQSQYKNWNDRQEMNSVVLEAPAPSGYATSNTNVPRNPLHHQCFNPKYVHPTLDKFHKMLQYY